MRAWRIRRYGGPEVLALEETPVPDPGPGEVLVRVAAASANPSDWRLREGELRRAFAVTFPRTLGRDCAGTVVASAKASKISRSATRSSASARWPGRHARRVACLHAYGRDAAPVAFADDGGDDSRRRGASAYIRSWNSRLSTGERVLIHAARAAWAFRAQSRATWAPSDLDLQLRQREFLPQLGADRVIDYAREDFSVPARGLRRRVRHASAARCSMLRCGGAPAGRQARLHPRRSGSVHRAHGYSGAQRADRGDPRAFESHR
jgi:hypothetical protein